MKLVFEEIGGHPTVYVEGTKDLIAVGHPQDFNPEVVGRMVDAYNQVYGDWLPIETAPTDGTLVILAISPDDDRENAIEDTTACSRTIGCNYGDNCEDKSWHFAGWNWSQDHFTEGRGTPIFWKPMPPAFIEE